MNINIDKAAEILLSAKQALIISHKDPDGDTLGSAFGLAFALKKIGKKIAVVCHDELPGIFDFIYNGFENDILENPLVVSVDIGSKQLLGSSLEHYEVDLSIDHHISNSLYAKNTYLDTYAAATTEIIKILIDKLNIKLDTKISNCLYTGIITDSGCFKYSNTTARTHIIAAELIEHGAEYSIINKKLFDTKSIGRIKLEQMVLAGMELFLGGQVAIAVISIGMMNSSNAQKSDVDGVSALPRQIEGVEFGITLKEQFENIYKVSLRTNSYIDAGKICNHFCGGGHMHAAGCVINEDLESAKKHLLDVVMQYLKTDL